MFCRINKIGQAVKPLACFFRAPLKFTAVSPKNRFIDLAGFCVLKGTSAPKRQGFACFILVSFEKSCPRKPPLFISPGPLIRGALVCQRQSENKRKQQELIAEPSARQAWFFPLFGLDRPLKSGYAGRDLQFSGCWRKSCLKVHVFTNAGLLAGIAIIQRYEMQIRIE